jgi:hypothetical protein
MKKLRMIVTSVIVLAIVGSAFAFKVKAGSFCVLTTTDAGSTCTGIIHDKEIVSSGGTQYKYYPSWTGNQAACTAQSNTLCTQTFRLAND